LSTLENLMKIVPVIKSGVWKDLYVSTRKFSISRASGPGTGSAGR
jgi:hypothetical protein